MTGPVPPAVAPPPAGTAGTSAGTTGTVTAASPEPAGEASLEKLPEKLKELLRTVVVSGTVIEQSGDGNVKVRTQAGEVSLKTPTPLPQDRQVTLQIPPGNPPLKALVFMVAPLQTPQAAPVSPPALPPQQVASPAPPPAQTPATGAPVPVAVPRAPAAVPVAVGTVMAATVASISPSPTPPATPVPAAPAPVPAPPAQPATPATPIQSAPSAPLNQTPPPAAPASAAPAPPTLRDAPAPAAPTQQQPAQQAKAPPAPSPAAPAQPATPPQSAPAPATPAPTAAPQPPPLQAASAPAPTPAPAPAPASAQPATQQLPALKPGTTVEVRIVALPPQQNATPVPLPSQTSQSPAPLPLPAPAPAATPPAPASTLPTLAATVAGTTSAGQPIVTTERGVMVLNTKSPLPHGTQVTIGLPPVRPAPAEPFDPLRGQDWPALRETLETLAKADPAGTRTLANAILPQANPRLAATLLAFTNGVKKGDARAWLGGEAVKTLEKLGRADLLEKLEEDFKQLARQAADVPPGDWKPYSIPFSDGTELHRILMHVRQPGAEDVEEDAGGADGHGARANRFLIDLTLSRIGELQLDGLIRPRRFDLILRTHLPLPPEMRQDIGKLFNGSLESLGMTGAVSFQAGTQGWVAVPSARSGRVGMSA